MTLIKYLPYIKFVENARLYLRSCHFKILYQLPYTICKSIFVDFIQNKSCFEEVTSLDFFVNQNMKIFLALHV